MTKREPIKWGEQPPEIKPTKQSNPTRLYLLVRQMNKPPVVYGFWHDTPKGRRQRDSALSELLDEHFTENITLLTVTDTGVWATSVKDWKLEKLASQRHP